MTTSVKTLSQLANHQEFIARHIGPDAEQTQAMLAELGLNSVEELIAQTVPAGIRLTTPLATGEAVNEVEALSYLKAVASKNKIFKSYIGMGYHPTHTPNVILRNVLEIPGLVHRVHAIPARNCAGPLRITAEFPAGFIRFNRHGTGFSVTAG